MTLGEGEHEVLVPGTASGAVLSLGAPLSFWGGVRESDGVIIDVHHPQQGQSVAGRVLVMPSGRGSSSSSSVLAELIRAGVGPAAILLGERDAILVIGAMVAEELYRKTVPIIVLSPAEYARCRGAAALSVSRGGEVRDIA